MQVYFINIDKTDSFTSKLWLAKVVVRSSNYDTCDHMTITEVCISAPNLQNRYPYAIILSIEYPNLCLLCCLAAKRNVNRLHCVVE